MIYGYARVSTDGQSLDAQVKQLRAAGAEKVLKETASGAKTDRAQLARVIGQLEKGDVLKVTRLDRLARSTRDLLNTLAAIAAKGRCKVQPGPFSDENLVTIESVSGPVSGFVVTDELREGPPRVRGIVHRVTKDFVEVWIKGSFFTTNGLTNVDPDLAMAA